MKHFSFTVNDSTAIAGMLASPDLASEAQHSSAILVQIYSALNQKDWYRELQEKISCRFPSAVIVGASTFGEIINGHTITGQTIVGFTFFQSSHIQSVHLDCDSGKEEDAGRQLRSTIDALNLPISGILLLTTPLLIDVASLMQGFQSQKSDFPVFGGGAGDYAEMSRSLVFDGNACFDSGVVAVVFSGSDLHIKTSTYLGWRMIGKEMTITDTDGLLVKSVDGKPAFDIYAHYLGVLNDEKFFLNALAFPFMFNRKNVVMARVPFGARKDGTIKFVADIKKGETFRMGYGNPEMIIRDAAEIKKDLASFDPDVLFLFSCCCRRFLMQNDVEKETSPFESIAPTFGFYTYGELHGTGENVKVLNSTLVAVGFREGPPENTFRLGMEEDQNDLSINHPQNTTLRLVHFLGAVTDELEQANEELQLLSCTDSLTQINNRGSLDISINKELARAARYSSMFSVILFDIDLFKHINDTFGHNAGDTMLQQIAETVRKTVRESDFVGRWGGDEFLIILPQTDLTRATQVAEKIREKISALDIPEIGHISCSFGVTSCCESDSEKSIIERADQALYDAKSAGRNQVRAR
ncbi:diguanylate cyclase [Leptolinea tardivitalis]|uniref:GGDEF domain-containing protein n=1 Tax=Leptolinea tardivitalis TaxID=229920 RepID=A0A0P6XEP2_9CHLR|nr:diguanylate cyclase [Leptolinea tardivitalis]KPL73299.1 hypothetical protein ADM99_03515 [Leptolinea tardivitalis]GAP21428.1 protein containing diguanylate cyclase (GGDEF) domain [Leptolinea tardivitalis]